MGVGEEGSDSEKGWSEVGEKGSEGVERSGWLYREVVWCVMIDEGSAGGDLWGLKIPLGAKL